MDKIQIIEKLFFNIVTYSYLLLPLTFLITIQKTRKTSSFFIYGTIFFLLLFFKVDVEGRTLRKLYSSSYTFLEYLFFTLALWREIRNRKFRIAMLILSVLFLSFQVFYFFKSSLHHLDSVPVGIETIILFIYILFFFYQYFKEIDNRYIYNEPCFWIAVGILLYMGGSFFFNILANHLSEQEMENYWYITYIAEVIKNILFAIAMIMYARQPKEPTPHKSIPYLDLTI